MKKGNIYIPAGFFLLFVSLLQAQDPALSILDNWEIRDAENEIKEWTISTLYERECLKLPGRHIAYLKDSSLLNFRMEMDIAGIAMPGFGFRGKDADNYEYIYLRVLCDNQGDALQYLPVYNGGFGWQLYNYPLYEKKASYPKRFLFSVPGKIPSNVSSEEINKQVKEYLRSGGVALSDAIVIMPTSDSSWKVIDQKNLTLHYLCQGEDSLCILNGLEWIHVKLEVIGKKALLFVEDMDIPAMAIDCLRGEEVPGLISLRNVGVDSYYANINIERIEDLPDYAKAEQGACAPVYLADWELSGKFRRNDETLEEQVDSVCQVDEWRPIHAEFDGLINMSKYFDVTDGTAILKTYIESPEEEEVELLFDYSEHLAISLNSEIIFSESLRLNNNEGRVMDEEEKITLQLKKGKNELLFILTSDAYKQNWGMIAKIAGLISLQTRK
jgi:hypothetical protein